MGGQSGYGIGSGVPGVGGRNQSQNSGCLAWGHSTFDRAPSPLAGKLADDSPEWSQAIVDYAKENRISRVVLAASWGLHADLGRKGEVRDPDLFDDVAQKLATTVRELRQTGAEVWIFKRVPMQTTDFRIGMARAWLEGRPQTISTPRVRLCQLHRE